MLLLALAACAQPTALATDGGSADGAAVEVPELQAPLDVDVRGLHDPIIATYVDTSLTCAEVEEFAGFALAYSPVLPEGTESFTCYIEGHYNTGRLPDPDAEGGPEPYDAHVIYLPSGVSIQSHGYQAAIRAGAVVFSSRRLPVKQSGVPEEAIVTHSDPDSSLGGYVATEVDGVPAVVTHILPGIHAVTWQRDGVQTQARSSGDPSRLLQDVQGAERGTPSGQERPTGR
ncbi:hypothetical protein BH23ACT9_BH23ACT9_30330 [soil metagenome]